MKKVLCGGAGALIAVIPMLLAPPNAGAAISAHTDVVFLFDTTGSMKITLSEARDEIRGATEEIDSRVPDVQYGVAEARDYGGSPYAEKEPGIVPWHLAQPITADRDAVARSIGGLKAGGGGDGAEAYGRALWETVTNPTVGWRAGSRRLIVLLGDSVPHDTELNEGIPASAWIKPSPWSTGEELLEPAGISGTLLNPSTVLDWQNVLQQLAASSTPLEVIEYTGEYLPYWENWAARTSGQATLAAEGQLGEQLVGLVVAGTRGPCPTVQGSTGKMLVFALKCKPALEALKAKCGTQLSLYKALKNLAAAKGTAAQRKVKQGSTPMAKLIRDIANARFLATAPVGFQDLNSSVERLGRARTALDLIKTLPHFFKAVPRLEFRQIAVDVADMPGARACAAGLVLAVQ